MYILNGFKQVFLPPIKNIKIPSIEFFLKLIFSLCKSEYKNSDSKIAFLSLPMLYNINIYKYLFDHYSLDIIFSAGGVVVVCHHYVHVTVFRE